MYKFSIIYFQNNHVLIVQRVDLFDVPKVAFNKLSLAMFEECVRLRQAREGHQLHILRKHLTRILHHDYDEVYRILQLYCAVSEFSIVASCR